MGNMPEAGRQVSHVLLDAVSAFEPNAGDTNERSLNLALERLDDIDDAVTLTVDDESGAVRSLEVSNLVGPSVQVIYWLVNRLAEERDTDIELVIAEAREFVDASN